MNNDKKCYGLDQISEFCLMYGCHCKGESDKDCYYSSAEDFEIKYRSKLSDLDYKIEILRDIVISLNNHRRGLSESDIDWKRFTERIEALDYAISVLIGKKSRIGFLFNYISRPKESELENLKEEFGLKMFYEALSRPIWTMIIVDNIEDCHVLSQKIKDKKIPFLYYWGSGTFIYCDRLDKEQIKKTLKLY